MTWSICMQPHKLLYVVSLLLDVPENGQVWSGVGHTIVWRTQMPRGGGAHHGRVADLVEWEKGQLAVARPTARETHWPLRLHMRGLKDFSLSRIHYILLINQL